MATLQSLGSVAGLINLDYGKFKYAVDQMRTSADGINGNVEERARGAERSEALDEFAEQFVQLQRIISLYKSLIKKDIDAIETTGEQLKEIDLKLESHGLRRMRFHDLRHPYVKHTTKIFSLRLMDFQAQAYPDARRKTRGACQLHRGGQSQSPVRPLCNRKRFS